MPAQVALFAITLLAPVLAWAQGSFDPLVWEASRPATAVKVMPGEKAGQYRIQAVVTDLDTKKIIAEPTLVARANEPATFEMGTPNLLLKLVVRIAQDGRSASYVGEIHKAGRLESAHSSSLQLGGA